MDKPQIIMIKEEHPEFVIIEQISLDCLLADYLRLKREEQLKALTPAEREIFDLLEQGLTHKAIASELVKTKNTVKTQVKGVLRKLGASTTKEALEKVKSGKVIVKNPDNDQQNHRFALC